MTKVQNLSGKTNFPNQCINPVFIECEQLLRNIYHKIADECYDENRKLKDDCTIIFHAFDRFMFSAAEEIGELARLDFVENAYCKVSRESEVCDA